MSTFFLVSYIISLILTIISLIIGIHAGIKRLNTVRVLPKALRLHLIFGCFPFFICTSLCSLYIAIFYILYNSEGHYSVDIARHIMTICSQQIRNTLVMIIVERIVATVKLETHTVCDNVSLFWKFTVISYLISISFLSYNIYAKSVPQRPYLYLYVSYFIYIIHAFMFTTCIILYRLNQRMYKISAYRITLKRRCIIAQNVKSLKYLFPIILIYASFAQFGALTVIIFDALKMPTLPVCNYHIFFNIAFSLIYLRHYSIKSEAVTLIKNVVMIKNPLGKNISTIANADQYFSGLQNQWKINTD